MPHCQLSLDLGLESSEHTQSVWFISADPASLGRWRSLLTAGHSYVLDAASGRQPVDRFDLVLLRVDNDSFEPYGCAGPLLNHSSFQEDATSCIASLLSPNGHKGFDLLGVSAHGGASSDELRGGTPLEALFAVLRPRKERAFRKVQVKACESARSELADDHSLLDALLLAQEARLRSIVGLDKPNNVRPNHLSPVKSGPLKSIHTAYFRSSELKRRQEADLFGYRRQHYGERDQIYSILRAQAIRIPIRSTYSTPDFSNLSPGAKLEIDETQLAPMLSSVSSRRLSVSTHLSPSRCLQVSVQSELRHRFSRLTSLCNSRGAVLLRIEDCDGCPVSNIKKIMIGDVMDIALPDKLVRSGRIVGNVSYSAAPGHWTRQSFRFNSPGGA